MSKIYPSFKDCFAFFLSPAIGAVIFSFILSLHGFIYDKDFQIYFFFVSLIFFSFFAVVFYSIPMAVFCFFIFYFGFNSRAINYFVFSLVGGGIAHFWPVFFGEGWFNVVGNLSFDKPMFFVLGFLSTLLMSYVVFSKR